jgi:hypothetical protein
VSQTSLETIPVNLTSTLGTAEWEVDLPLDVAVQSLIAKFVRDPQFDFRERDEAGNLIPYRLLWQDRNRYLSESETLRIAGVERNNTLVMAHEPRAGLGNG